MFAAFSISMIQKSALWSAHRLLLPDFVLLSLFCAIIIICELIFIDSQKYKEW